VKIEVVEDVTKKLDNLNLQKSGRARGAFRRSLRYAVKKTWIEAVEGAGVKSRTGRLISPRFVYEDIYTITMILPMHARFFWKGARRSLGRWIKYIYVREGGKRTKRYLGKRFRKDKREAYVQKYGIKFVGYHPGIRTSKFPVRRLFEDKIDDNVIYYLNRWYNRQVKGGG